jgi:CheY-like chemotaxis protein
MNKKQTKLKILVVDDSALTRAIFKKMLEEFYEIIAVSSGTEGLHSFQKQKISLVILDYNMPEMNGLEVARRIKLLDKKVPIILDSVHFSKDIKIKADKIGINDYLFKDFEKKDLLNKIGELIQE